jgi:glucokinase
MPVVAMDLGGTKLAAAAFGDDGALLVRESVPLAGRTGGDVVALMCARYAAACSALRDRGLASPGALGVAVPGIYRAARGTVWAPNIPGWDDQPLRDALLREVAPGTPVVIDSDRAACILGETWQGSARGLRDAVFLVVGTGIGAGVLADGRLLRGVGDVAGAVGWFALDSPFRDEYVGCGCFEHHASGPGLAKVARERLAAAPDYEGELRRIPAASLTAEHLFAAHERGDPIALAVLDAAIGFWGMAAANLVSLLNPEAVVFGGGVFGPAARFIDRIREEALRWAQPIAVREARFVASALGADAALYGAGRLASLAASRGAPTVGMPTPGSPLLGAPVRASVG